MIANVNAGDIIGYKYFGLGGLKKDSKGIEAFDGTTSKQHSSFNIWYRIFRRQPYDMGASRG